MGKILLLPDLRNSFGGPASFQNNFADILTNKNIEFTYNKNDSSISCVLLINGTKDIYSLIKYKIKGVKIVQRLGSPIVLQNYLSSDFLTRIRFKIVTLYLNFIRRYFADKIIYQSNFVKSLWENNYGRVNTGKVIYNGTDIRRFKINEKKKENIFRIISVEGAQGNDPFDIGLNLANELSKRRNDFEIIFIGKNENNFKEKIKSKNNVKFIGKVKHYDLLKYYNSSDIFLLTDIIQAGCPNSVIEAQACGLPVVSYKVGAVCEIVDKDFSKLIPPKNNPWEFKNPKNYKLLADACEELFISMNNEKRRKIRKKTEENHCRIKMSEKYISELIN